VVDDDPTKRVPTEDPDDQPTVRGLAAGRKVFGRYVLEAVLGQGGMGVVWRARDEELGNLVALKFLPEVVARDATAVDELREETRNALRLTHPNIVRIRNFEREGNVAAVSMEYIDGTTFSQLRLAQPGKVFSAEKLVPLVAQVCAALDYAHGEAKVVHRDLKPANLLVTPEGRIKIADFGIARSLADTHTRLTGRTVGTSGTLLYMSPQQLLGRKASASDDIYALGATLYELLTGRPPFFTGDIATQVQSVTPPPLAERRSELGIAGEPIPVAWEQTVAACLAKDLAQRPQTAREVADRLEIKESGASSQQPDGLPRNGGRSAELQPAPPDSDADERSLKNFATESRPRPRSKRLFFAAALAVLALGVIGYLFWPKTGPAPASSHFDSSTAKSVMVFDETKAEPEGLDPFALITRATAAAAPVDETKAKAEKGDAKAQAGLGRMYYEGVGVPKDNAEALKWLRKAADQGNADGQCALGWMYEFGEGVAKDQTEAVKWFRKAADQDYTDAQLSLSLAYAEGDGVPKDSAEAIKWCRKGLEGSNPFAPDAWAHGVQYDLGVMYANGEGGHKDSAEAVKWYRKAADRGNEFAQFNLGLMYDNGDGVPKDSAEAAKWYRKAADQGNAKAQFNLGLIYENGDGVPKDSVEAARCYRKAADQGNAKAQGNLGAMYANGDGVPKDEIEALAWCNIAAASGNDVTVKNRDALELRLGREKTLVAQQRSKEILKEIETAKAR
jgi:TPR repeat protein/serine/threonine protein kinase